MPILRLAYTTQFLLTLLAAFFLWSEVGGQSHLDLMPWYLKLVLGVGVAFAVVKATAGAVAHDRVWNAQTLRWTGILLVLLIGCGLASYYVHTYGEQDEEQDDNLTSSTLIVPPGSRPIWSGISRSAPVSSRTVSAPHVSAGVPFPLVRQRRFTKPRVLTACVLRS